MKILPGFLCVVLLSSCGNLEPQETATFFDLDSLVTAQVRYLSELKPQVKKDGLVQDRSDSQALTTPDSVQWSRELAIFKNADINKPRLRDRYTEERKTLDNGLSEITYRPREDDDLTVKLLRIRYQDQINELREIKATINDSNPLYASKREIKMEFNKVADEVRLKSYFIEGGQKMRLKDSVTFDLNAEVIYPDQIK